MSGLMFMPGNGVILSLVPALKDDDGNSCATTANSDCVSGCMSKPNPG